jgi:hypothetical protein
MLHQNESFKDQRIELSGNSFHGCTFERCELVYRGDPSPTFQDNEFIDSVFLFTDSAIRTIYFLSNMYHTGAGGREVVEKTFDDIRRGAIHGHIARTVPPHTSDHSLKGA